MNRTMLVALLLLLPVLAAVGCRTTPTSAGATTGGVEYLTGSYSKSYAHSVPDTYKAVLALLEADHIPVYQKEVGATIGTISGTLSDGKKLTVDFKASAVNVTIVTIRVGAFGEEARTNYFFDEIDKRLHEPGMPGAKEGTGK